MTANMVLKQSCTENQKRHFYPRVFRCWRLLSGNEHVRIVGKTRTILTYLLTYILICTYSMEQSQPVFSQSTYNINWLAFITEMKSVYSAVRTGSLNKAVCASSVKVSNIIMPTVTTSRSVARKKCYQPRFRTANGWESNWKLKSAQA